jgi:hypothetical protein
MSKPVSIFSWLVEPTFGGAREEKYGAEVPKYHGDEAWLKVSACVSFAVGVRSFLDFFNKRRAVGQLDAFLLTPPRGRW